MKAVSPLAGRDHHKVLHILAYDIEQTDINTYVEMDFDEDAKAGDKQLTSQCLFISIPYRSSFLGMQTANAC